MAAEEERQHDGEIKGAPPQEAKPLTWLGFLRGVGRLAVPLASETFVFLNPFSALAIQSRSEGMHERQDDELNVRLGRNAIVAAARAFPTRCCAPPGRPVM